MTRTLQTAAGIRASARSFFRKPFNIVLLILLPALSIKLYGTSLAQFPEFEFLRTSASLAITGRITGAVFATGALAGVLGLFQIISARDADRRLSICGFPPTDLLISRFVTLIGISVIIAGVSTITLLVLVAEPIGAPAFVFVGLILGSVIYAMLGILVGTVLPRELEGSLVLVILADMDNVLASGIFQIDQSITRYSPLSYPHDIVTQAVVDGTFAHEQVLPALAFVAVFGVLAVTAYSWTVEPVEAGGEAV